MDTFVKQYSQKEGAVRCCTSITSTYRTNIARKIISGVNIQFQRNWSN